MIPFTVTGNTERSSFGGEIRNLVSDVHIECEVPMNHSNGAIKETVYISISSQKEAGLEAYIWESSI